MGQLAGIIHARNPYRSLAMLDDALGPGRYAERLCHPAKSPMANGRVPAMDVLMRLAHELDVSPVVLLVAAARDAGMVVDDEQDRAGGLVQQLSRLAPHTQELVTDAALSLVRMAEQLERSA